jgi:integrase
MPRSRTSIPSYRLHKPTGQAVVTIRTATGERRDMYLGKYESTESRAEYARVIAELATGSPAPSSPNASVTLTVDQVLLRWWKHAERHYRRPDGSPTNQLVEYKYTLQPVNELYGHTPAKDFSPLALKAVRQRMVASKWCRNQVNDRISKVKRVFKWAVSEQLVPVTVYTALATVTGLQKGRTEVREKAPIGAVETAVVDATLPHVNRHVWGLVRFQQYTGCRPGEACLVRRRDIDMTRDVWVFTPPTHKTAHKGKRRAVAIGPRAQAVLRGFFTEDPTAYLFNPRRAVEEHHAKRSAERKTPNWPSAVKLKAKRKKPDAKKQAERYTAHAYSVAVRRAVERVNHLFTEAGVELELHLPHWHPNMLRHAFGTLVRRQHDLEHAGAALGHTKMSATEIYAARDAGLAEQIAAEMG